MLETLKIKCTFMSIKSIVKQKNQRKKRGGGMFFFEKVILRPAPSTNSTSSISCNQCGFSK